MAAKARTEPVTGENFDRWSVPSRFPGRNPDKARFGVARSWALARGGLLGWDRRDDDEQRENNAGVRD